MTTSTAAEGGIWFDGVDLYDLDGEFIQGLSSLYGDDNWSLYPVRDILGAYTIAAFDDCRGHFNPGVGYHVRASMGCSGIEVEGHGQHFAYVLDGYPIFAALAEEEVSASDLDPCGGHHIDALGYHYHAAPSAENSVVRCLTGEIVNDTSAGPPPGRG